MTIAIAKVIDGILGNRKFVFTSIILASILAQSLFLIVLGDAEKRAQPVDYIKLYKPETENILNGNGFVDNEGNLMVRVPPGYPLYLTMPLFVKKITGFQDITIIKIFNVFTTAAATIVFFLIDLLLIVE